MVSADQIEDCQERGWIVVVPEHRLCPQVDILQGPVSDCRDLLDWIYAGGLDEELASSGATSPFKVDDKRVVTFGTSSGGTLALTLGFDVKRPVVAILDLYGATNFQDSFWTQSLTFMKPPECSESFMSQVYEEKPVPIQGGLSLEGQTEDGKPPPMGPRTAFTMTHIAKGTLLDVCYPSKDWKKIDACLNVAPEFPPTCIVHGLEDKMVPPFLSRTLCRRLEEEGVRSQFIDVPGEGHTFAGKMSKGSRTWDLQRKGFDFLESIIGR
ncbi:alpha/beta-hydrolase [Viridothelium virens]|uniref:Alpha/beta-hydrolase n=1 Tax=Viridothelium virens TaxID=1048519 RepID=A0A6A6HAX1_VIRVR|nr:alpha/beta-hydrolase [Viridothelium virens]